VRSVHITVRVTVTVTRDGRKGADRHSVQRRVTGSEVGAKVKVKLSHCTSGRRMGKWSYSSTQAMLFCFKIHAHLLFEIKNFCPFPVQ